MKVSKQGEKIGAAFLECAVVVGYQLEDARIEERRRAAQLMRDLLAAMDDGDTDDAESAVRAYIAEADE